VNNPFLKGCGSQLNLYVPGLSVMLNVLTPSFGTDVCTLTPGPVRWKSWTSDSSATTSLTAPA
jgi:hypothetical protein